MIFLVHDCFEFWILTVSDIFQCKRLNPHESEKILNFLVEELKSAQTEGGLLVASRITEHLLSEKNPFHGKTLPFVFVKLIMYRYSYERFSSVYNWCQSSTTETEKEPYSQQHYYVVPLKYCLLCCSTW